MSAAVGDEPMSDDASPPINRMAIAVLALVGVLLSTYLLLYKLGVIGTLECSIGGCQEVQASPYAYFMGVPVAAWGLIGYAVILGVALAGVQPRWIDDRRIAMGLLTLGTAAMGFSAYLTALEAYVIRAWCQWCVVSAIIATLIFLLSLPELFRLRARNHG